VTPVDSGKPVALVSVADVPPIAVLTRPPFRTTFAVIDPVPIISPPLAVPGEHSGVATGVVSVSYKLTQPAVPELPVEMLGTPVIDVPISPGVSSTMAVAPLPMSVVTVCKK
jgi:hypothetical protein